jgi:hypothetical protein
VHAAGIVHGDIKASNVMREGDDQGANAGRIVLMDFGSAHETARSGTPSAGTPLYSAPEVLAGGTLTASADVYALGVLLYRLVSGQFPIVDGPVDALLARHAAGDRRSLRALRPDLPPAFVQIVERAIDPDPRHRCRDAGEMERALLAVLGARSETQARHRFDVKALAAAFVLGAVVCSGAWWATLQWPRWTQARFRIAPTGPAIATSLAAVVPGSEQGGNFGHALAVVGDVNGDSLPDLLVGSVHAEGGRGSADLLLGRRGAAPQPALHMRGGGAGDAFGYAVAGGGDLNGDGTADFAIAAKQADAGQVDTGGAYVFFGGTGLDAEPDLTVTPGEAHGYFGNTLACSGDVNGDGYADLAVGAPLATWSGSPTGRAFVYWGGAPMDAVPDLELSSAAVESQFGVAVAIGDLNGDGFAEVIVGSNWENTDGPLAGRVYVYHGGRNADATADLTLRGPHEQALFGYPLCVLDLNGDQFGDLAVGSGGSQGDQPLQVRIYFGGSRFDAQPDLTLAGPSASDAFGYAIVPAGDVNGDGLADLLVTAPFQDEVMRNSGAVYVYFGGRDMDAIADLQVLGEQSWERFGWSVAALGDSRGDGFGDFVVGAPGGVRDTGKLCWFEAQRYALERPRPGDVWQAGRQTTIAWRGGERADVALSTDGGRSFVRIAAGVGGQDENSFTFLPPSTGCDSAWVRLSPAQSAIGGESVRGPIRIVP